MDMTKWATFLATLLFASGCALQHTLMPVSAPDSYPAGRLPGHVVVTRDAPTPTILTFFNLVRYTTWGAPPHTFASFVFCPTGLPAPNTTKKCFHSYGGVKIDGTESHKLQAEQLEPFHVWDYVYTASEQSAFRWHDVDGTAIPYNMGGF